jgi:adenylylsulfate kinase
VPVIVSLISPYRQNREEARKIIGNGFMEVYVKCPLEECEARDVKGMYRKAREGIIRNFTGIDDPYEEPESPDIVIDSARNTVDECVSLLLKAYQMNQYSVAE